MNKYHVPGRCDCLLDKSPESIKDVELWESTIAAFLQESVAVVKLTAGTAAILTEYGSLNPAMCAQAVGASRNSVNCFFCHRPTLTGTDQFGHFVCGCLCGSAAIFLNRTLVLHFEPDKASLSAAQKADLRRFFKPNKPPQISRKFSLGKLAK